MKALILVLVIGASGTATQVISGNVVDAVEVVPDAGTVELESSQPMRVEVTDGGVVNITPESV